jgi:hypothetical protein
MSNSVMRLADEPGWFLRIADEPAWFRAFVVGIAIGSAVGWYVALKRVEAVLGADAMERFKEAERARFEAERARFANPS